MIGSYYPTPQSYYADKNWATPFWQMAPVPGWGVDPMSYEVDRVGVGALPGGCGCGTRGVGAAASDAYLETSWGMVAMGTAGGIGLGMLFMHLYKSSKKRAS